MSAPGSQVVTGSTDADRSLPARQAGDTPLVQAAQLSDLASRNCALAGGANPPGPQSRPRRRRRPLSNKLEFRTDPATADVIEALADKAGLTRSEAMRRLILAGAGQPQLFISPRNPPEQLETLLGALVRFRGDLPRHPLPAECASRRRKSDPDLAMLTRDWRARVALIVQRNRQNHSTPRLRDKRNAHTKARPHPPSAKRKAFAQDVD